MINFGAVPSGAVLPVFFSTYGKTNGESITLTGLAVTDIEIYKGVSTTQRASDNGYTLMDTDGIDVDGVTGIHGFSIDTGDNTDAGFYAVGSFFTVVVSAVTVDSQTVNFIAATFRIVAAEGVAGKPKADVDAFGGTAGTFASGIPEVKVASIANNAITAASAASDFGAEVADAVLDRDMSTGTDSGSTTVRTPRQAFRVLRNKVSISGSTMTVTKENDSTSSWTAELTTSASADPVTAIDPAGP